MIPQPVTPVVEEKSVVTQVCRQCGALNSPSLRFCEQCAAQLVPGLPPVEARSRPMQACPRCGRQNPSGLNFCEQCVAPLVAVVPAVPAPSRRRFRLRRWLAVGVAAMLVVAIATVVAVVVGQMPTVTKREAMDIAGGVIEASYPDLIREEPTLRTNKGARETTYSVEYRIEYELQTDAGPATVPGGVIIVVDAESGETQMLGIK
jgi:ribosomal protein L40E